MARQVQIIKGTTEQNNGFTGAEGVLTYDSDKKDIRIHDGTTAGGFEIPSSAMADYVIYWDSTDSTDHSHAKPGVPTPTNNGWYRIYKSGWCEQGITYSNNIPDPGWYFYIPMKNTTYSLMAGGGFTIANHGAHLVNKYTDHVASWSDAATTSISDFVICGWAA